MGLNDMAGEPNWIELFTPDPDGAREFYGGLFGWTVQETGPEFGNYALFLRDGAPVAGCMRNDGQGVSAWTVYLDSPDAAATVEMAKANGGDVIAPAMQVGTLGHMAVVTDPSGAAVGVWQPMEHPGFAVRGEVGAPAWFEELTDSYDAVLPFYENAFGWDTHTMSDSPDFRYTTLGRDEHALAGIMDASSFFGDETSHWTVYVAVEDTDEAVATAVRLGGREVLAPEDTPYGRMAAISDPAGITFRLMGPTRG